MRVGGELTSHVKIHAQKKIELEVKKKKFLHSVDHQHQILLRAHTQKALREETERFINHTQENFTPSSLEKQL